MCVSCCVTADGSGEASGAVPGGADELVSLMTTRTTTMNRTAPTSPHVGRIVVARRGARAGRGDGVGAGLSPASSSVTVDVHRPASTPRHPVLLATSALRHSVRLVTQYSSASARPLHPSIGSTV